MRFNYVIAENLQNKGITIEDTDGIRTLTNKVNNILTREQYPISISYGLTPSQLSAPSNYIKGYWRLNDDNKNGYLTIYDDITGNIVLKSPRNEIIKIPISITSDNSNSINNWTNFPNSTRYQNRLIELNNYLNIGGNYEISLELHSSLYYAPVTSPIASINYTHYLRYYVDGIKGTGSVGSASIPINTDSQTVFNGDESATLTFTEKTDSDGEYSYYSIMRESNSHLGLIGVKLYDGTDNIDLSCKGTFLNSNYYDNPSYGTVQHNFGFYIKTIDNIYKFGFKDKQTSSSSNYCHAYSDIGATSSAITKEKYSTFGLFKEKNKVTFWIDSKTNIIACGTLDNFNNCEYGLFFSTESTKGKYAMGLGSTRYAIRELICTNY